MNESYDSYMLHQMAEGIKKIQKAEKKKQMRDSLSPRLSEVFTREGYMPLQVLIFHYLGWLESLPINNEKESVLLAVIFNKEGSENIRKALSNLQALKSRQNLEDLKELFEILDLEEPLKKVKRDIDKVSEK